MLYYRGRARSGLVLTGAQDSCAASRACDQKDDKLKAVLRHGYADNCQRTPPIVTKRIVTHRKAPTRTVTRTETRHPVRTVQRVETRAVQLDMGSFTGGVGAGVGGDFYGGGGAVIISSGRSYSGVMSHTASSYTYRSHRGYRGGGKKRRGGGGCGC